MQYGVLHRLVGGILIGAGVGYFTMYGDGLVLLLLLVAGNVEHVLVLDGNVRHRTFQDAVDVDAHHLERSVGLGAVHHAMLADGFLGQSSGCLNQGFHRVDLAAHLVHARTEHGANDLHHILIAHNGGIHGDGVLVHQAEVVGVELADVEHRVLLARFAVYADALREGIARESSGIA